MLNYRCRGTWRAGGIVCSAKPSTASQLRAGPCRPHSQRVTLNTPGQVLSSSQEPAPPLLQSHRECNGPIVGCVGQGYAQIGSEMETTTTQLFWKLVEEKAGIKPATKPDVFHRTFTPKEQHWERFRTVKGETGTIVSDFQLSGEAFEDDLDPMAVVEIEPRCHPLVLHDAALDQSWSPEASTVRAKVDAGRKPRFERGGDGKAYGRRYIANQFKSLDMSMERMKLAKVGGKLTKIDADFAKEVPNLEELSVSGQALTKIDNLPKGVIVLNAHCNKLTEWPTLPNKSTRHLGLSGNLIQTLDSLPREVAVGYSSLFSLDLSMNRLCTMHDIKPLLYLPAIRILSLHDNPICLLHDYRQRVVSSILTLETFDNQQVLDNERSPSLAMKREKLPWETPTPPPTPPPPKAEGEEGEGAGEGEEAAPPPEEGGAEGEEGEIAEPPPVPRDDDTEIEIGFVATLLGGLKDPNEEPPAPPAPAEDEPLKEEEEEETEEMRVFNFYTENPPVFFATFSIHGQPPVQTERVAWSEEGNLPLATRKVLRFKCTYDRLQWLRFEGVNVTLFEERLQMPPRPKPPPAEGEEGGEEGEGEGEGAGGQADGGEGGGGGGAGGEGDEGGEEGVDGEEKEPSEPVRVYEVKRIAAGTIEANMLLHGVPEISADLNLMTYDIAQDIVRPLDDRYTEKALAAIKKDAERAERAARKEAEKAAARKGSTVGGKAPAPPEGTAGPDAVRQKSDAADKLQVGKDAGSSVRVSRKPQVVATLSFKIALNPSGEWEADVGKTEEE